MTQNKFSAYLALKDSEVGHRVSNLYDLIIYVNDIIRKKFDFNKSSLEVFIEVVAKISIERTLH